MQSLQVVLELNILKLFLLQFFQILEFQFCFFKFLQLFRMVKVFSHHLIRIKIVIPHKFQFRECFQPILLLMIHLSRRGFLFDALKALFNLRCQRTIKTSL